jgi:hypothetical protein
MWNIKVHLRATRGTLPLRAPDPGPCSFILTEYNPPATTTLRWAEVRPPLSYTRQFIPRGGRWSPFPFQSRGCFKVSCSRGIWDSQPLRHRHQRRRINTKDLALHGNDSAGVCHVERYISTYFVLSQRVMLTSPFSPIWRTELAPQIALRSPPQLSQWTKETRTAPRSQFSLTLTNTKALVSEKAGIECANVVRRG